MHDGAERVHRLAVQQDVHLDEVRDLLAGGLVVERGVALGLALQLVEEVEDDLGEGQRVAQLHPFGGQVLHAEQGAAAALAQLHDGADILVRHQNCGAHHRLVDLGDLAGRELARVGDRRLLRVLGHHLVDHVRRGGDQVEAELALQALADDLQVQQAQIADAETEAERRRRLRLVGERGVVQLQLVQRVPQGRIVRAVDRVETRVDHRLRVLVAAQGVLRRPVVTGDGVADPGLADILHAGDQVAHLADAERGRLLHLRRDHADLEELVDGAGGHHLDLVARLDPAVDDPDVRDHAAIHVVDRVEDHRAGRGGGVTDRSGELPDDLVEQVIHPDAGLAGHPQDLRRLDADQLGQLLRILLGLRRRQVDLVEHRDDAKVVLHRQVQVGESLRLDPLRGVDQQNRALTGGETAGHLVGEVDVTRGVDHVEDGGLALPRALADGPRHAHGLRLDRDAALALDVHPVQVLRAHLARVDHPGDLQHPVGQRGLPVVDVSDDAEVADAAGIGRSDHVHAGVERSRHGRPFFSGWLVRLLRAPADAPALPIVPRPGG